MAKPYELNEAIANEKGVWTGAALNRQMFKGSTRGLTDSDIYGLLVIADNTEEIVKAIGTTLARALEAVGIQAEGDSKKICPVDTGRLRNSITHTIDAGDMTAVIGTNVEYALYVHEGTHGRKGQPFLVDAVTQNKDKYRRIIEKMLEG